MAEIDKNCVEGNCFAINDKSHASGDTTLNIVYKANYTGQICTARFRIKSKDGSVVKEYMIAQEAKPVFYNIKMVQAFTKDDCMANQHGTVVLYTVPERRYSSLISQEDADAKALEDINLNGQDYANLNGECITDIWYSKEMSREFVRNNCDKFSDGQPYTYVVPEGKYVSSISQEDADAKAAEDIEKFGQQQANIEGECREKENIYYGKFSHTFTRNNCNSTEYGTEFTVDETMVTGDFRSITSQEDANRLAEIAVMEQGQDIANVRGNCEKIPVYTGSYSKIFKRTNCPDGSTPVNFTVNEKMCEGYPFQSTESQDAANAMAQRAVEEQGQAITNEQGDCQTNLYFNVRMEKTVTRNNCDQWHEGQQYTYVVEAGKYSSNISQADADNKAKVDLEANAQQQANLEGECRELPVFYGKFEHEFTRNNCDETQYGTKVMVDETMVTGDFRSLESQEAANALAEAAVMAQGQDIANIKGNCEKIPVYTGVCSKVFRRTNCPDGSTPVDFTVNERMCEGYPFTSTVSQEDANEKACEAVNEQGQAITNEQGDCQTNLYYNTRQERTFTRNNCDEWHEGQPYTYVVPAGKYSSNISQDDANQKALDDIAANGQQQANIEGECKQKTIYYGEYSQEFTKDNCDETQYGTTVVVDETMVTGDFRSTVSQADANKKAEAAVKAQGQDVANTKGKCEKIPVFTGSASKVFTRNNCPGDGVPGTYTVTDRMCEGYPFTSTVSQEEANEKALEAVNNEGQAIANANATCTFTGHASLEIQKNDCEPHQIGSMVVVTEEDVQGHPFLSTESQAAANSAALTAIQAYGQPVANERGTCTDKQSYVGVASFKFTKSNCPENQLGDEFEVTQDMVDGAPFVSYNSQEEANLLALAAVMDQGQAIADEQGTCHEAPKYTGHYSTGFTKNDCEAGKIPTVVTVTEADVTGGPFYSYESQFAADQKAKEAVEEQGQAIANERGTCNDYQLYVGDYSAAFTPACPECHYADPVTVSASMMGYVSIETSQEVADAKARQYVELMGQAYVDKNYANTCHTIEEQPVWETSEEACRDCISQLHQFNTNDCYTGPNQEQWVPGGTTTCFWFGVASKKFTKQCADGGIGTEETVTQADVTDPNPSPDGKFKSCVSQADANQKALEAVNSQGQSVANNRGTCTWYGQYTGNVQKDDCADGGVGDIVSVNSDNLANYPYESHVSLADANARAQADVMGELGQEYANKNGGCTWTYVASRTFYRNNCEGDGVGQSIVVTSTQANGGTAVTSKVSLADAQSKAEQVLDENGQDYANQHGTCLWTGDASISLDKSDCGTCQHSARKVTVYYSYLGLTDITSTISQEDANQKALNALNGSARTQAQAYADKNGRCDPDSTASDCRAGSTYCDGCTLMRDYYQANDCSSDSCSDSVIEYDSRECGCGCSDERHYSSATCRNGTSQRYWTSECEPSQHWEDYGTACCDGPGVPYSGLGPGDWCGYSSTSAANSAASSEVESRKADAAASAKCGQMVCNDFVESTKYKSCPSNCTAPSGYAYWTAGGNSGAWCECNGDKSALTAAAQASADALAQQKADAQECDCPDPECSMDVRVSIDGWETSGSPHINFTVSWNGNGYCSDYLRTGTVYIYCGGSQIYSTSLTLRGESGSWSSSANYTSGCNPSTAYGSFS